MLALGETAVLGAFCAQDLALFVLFFDLMLVPFYFLIGIWGGPDRVRATTTFVIYTLVGSLLMLAAAVATGILATPDGGRARRSSSPSSPQRPLSEGTQEWIFLLLRARLPGEDAGLPAARLDAGRLHERADARWSRCSRECCRRSAPTGSCASRCRCFPHAASQFQELLLVIAVASILYGSVMAFTQTSATLVVGYSSIAQLGFITLGIFSLRDEGAQGAVLQMVNHGLVVVPLFFIIALLAARVGRHRRPAPDGRARDARAGAGGAVPDRRAGDARDARLGQLRRASS